MNGRQGSGSCFARKCECRCFCSGRLPGCWRLACSQAALKLLLAKETRLLQTLERLRVNARHENKARHTQQQLGSLAQPKTWVVSNGKKVGWVVKLRMLERAAVGHPVPVSPVHRAPAGGHPAEPHNRR